MIRLRQSLEAGVRHPLLGPLLLLSLGLILAFVVFHTIEHGIEGLLFSCMIVVAMSLRLAVVRGRAWRATADQLSPFGRGPPNRGSCLLFPSRLPPLVALPLRL